MMIDPFDVKRFSENLARALIDEDWRRDAVCRGYDVSGSYSWNACVDRTVSVYRTLAF
jgi:hypothetical protein